jgi:hypothetical protein
MLEAVINPLTPAALAELGEPIEILTRGQRTAKQLGEIADDVVAFALGILPEYRDEFSLMATQWRGPRTVLRRAIQSAVGMGGRWSTMQGATTMPLSLSNLVAALDQFPRYHAIDVFADDLGELRQLPPSFRPVDAQGRSFLVPHEGREFRLEIFPAQGVARLSKNGTPPVVDATGGAIVSGLVGTAIDAAGKQKGTGLLGGLLLGLLIGESLGGAAGDARRVFALTYDHAAGQWRAYDGGLLRWMKGQLAV